MSNIIGIIGGASPEASAKLYSLIIHKCKNQGCYYDWEFPHIIIDSVPFKNILSEKNREEVRIQFEKSISRLTNSGAKYILVNCNSLYALTKNKRYDVEDLPKRVYEVVTQKNHSKIGLLATSITIQSGVYDIFIKNGIEVKLPEIADQKKLDDIILNLGNKNEMMGELQEILEKLREQKVETIVLGCTDIHLYFEQLPNDIIDTLGIIADLAVEYHTKHRQDID